LLQKLRLYTLNENVINWIKSFLCCRTQRVKLNGFYLDWPEVLSGIPQGTILGPILFLIYINDLPYICQQFVEIYLFADDAKLYKHVTSEDDHVSLQMGLDVLQEWSDRWLLKLNVSKCKTVFYGRNINHDYNYYLHSNKIDKVNKMKDLCVTFDPELSFNFHYEDKINKSYSVLGLIKRNFIYLTEGAFVSLYKSLVRCHLEYANSVWNPHRQGQIKDLEKVQMRATKLVMTVKHLSYKERLARLKLPTLKYRRTRGDTIEVYKILTDKYDNNVNLPLERQKDSITRGHSLKLVHPRCQYDLRKYSFTVRIVNLRNSLPENVISANTVDTFKNRLDKFWSEQELVYDYKADLTGIIITLCGMIDRKFPHLHAVKTVSGG